MNAYSALLLNLLLLSGLPSAMQAQLPARTVPEDQLRPYEGGVDRQPIPFELSAPMLSPEGPTIPQGNWREGVVYDKVVAIGWSGVNDWVQFMEALGTFGLSMQGADEVHIFAGNPSPPVRSDYTDAVEYREAERGYKIENDFVLAKANPVTYPQLNKLMGLKYHPHGAASAELIPVLEELYLEALTGKKIQLTMMVSNHGTFVVGDKTFEMEGADGRINEQDLAYIGRLMAPIDTTIVNGTCFGSDHVDLISQHMVRHRDELIKKRGMVDLAGVCSFSVTRALLGRPAFGTKSAFEGDMFSRANQGSSIQVTFLNTMKGEVIGHAAVGIGDDPWATNLPLSSSDKLAFHMRAFFAHKDLKSGKLDGSKFSNTTVTPNFVDEGDGAVFAHQFDSTYVDLSGVRQLPELRSSLLENQKAVEAQLAELELPELRDFSFNDSGKGAGYAKIIAEALAKREGAGIRGGKINGSRLEKVLETRAVLQKNATYLAQFRVKGDLTDPIELDGIYYGDDPAVKTYKGKPVRYIPDALDDVEKKIATMTVGNDGHKWKFAAAMIGRHLMAVEKLTDPEKFVEDGMKMSRLQQLYVSYKTCERQHLIPEPFYVEESGKRVRKSIRQMSHRAPADHIGQAPPTGH